jgi:hypothetical protein
VSAVSSCFISEVSPVEFVDDRISVRMGVGISWRAANVRRGENWEIFQIVAIITITTTEPFIILNSWTPFFV